METGLEGKYVIKDNKKLAFGYTTGSCGAAAAKAAARMLFTGNVQDTVELMTPKGILLKLPVLKEEDFIEQMKMLWDLADHERGI